AQDFRRLPLKHRLMRLKALLNCEQQNDIPSKPMLRIKMCSAQALLRGDAEGMFDWCMSGKAALNFNPAERDRCPRMG
ncbi:MAG: hypothetical protein M3O00_05000, partial [Pseudomonadota bacterium]|nr:hypothetical protein [Pseudomonadota bacterium]